MAVVDGEAIADHSTATDLAIEPGGGYEVGMISLF
jgi:hypothetical protein